jgi:hypothetical protein
MRRLIAYSLFLTLAVSGTALASSKLEPAGPAEAPTLKGNVLVWHDALLFADPSETARTLQLATFDVTRKDRVGHVVAMKVIAGKGAFVEVELAAVEEECTWSRIVLPDDLARVRLFVRRADIAPVLVKPYAKSFADGTSISLAVGTPVVATDAGTYIVSLRGDEVELDVPAASVGYAYVPPKATTSINGMGQTIALAASTKAVLGNRELVFSAAWNGAPVEKRGESAVVAIEDRCMTAHLVVPAKAISQVDESTIEVTTNDETKKSSVLSLRDDVVIPKLTPLSIGDRQVAVAAQHIFLHQAPTGKHACIQRTIKLESALEIKATDAKLRVCAPAASVAREVRRNARRGTAQR